MDIKNILEQRIMILDGGMGTLIQKHTLEEEDFRGTKWEHHNSFLKGNNELLSITRADIITKIHESYCESGADIIETNTFNANRISQSDYGLEDFVYELNYESAKIAKQVAVKFSKKDASKPRFVAGAIGPTNKTASLSPDVNNPGYRAVNFQTLKNIYKEQLKGLMDAEVDILLIETIFDTLNAKAALFGIEEFFEESGKRVPVMISGTITDASGRTLSGQTTEAFLISVSHSNPLSIGLNCALGAAQLRPYLQILSEKCSSYVSAYPNAGLPNEFGEYDQNPEQMAVLVETFMQENLINIIGGCCGTTPEHIHSIATLAEKYPPRIIPNNLKNR